MPKKYLAQVCPIRYMPDRYAKEVFNLGVLLVDASSGYAQVRFTHNERRLRCLDPMVDMEMIRDFEAAFRERVDAGNALDPKFLNDFESWGPDCLKISIDSPIATDDLDETMRWLANKLLKPRMRPENGPARANKGIRQALRNAFESDPELRPFFQTKIKVSDYVPGDPLLIDCGYEAGKIFKMFHAVPLDKSAKTVKELALSYPMYRDGFVNNRSFTPQLVAVIPDNPPAEQKAFADRVFGGCQIELRPQNELPALMDEARKDLRAYETSDLKS
jgi:hypothetical protein